MGDNPKKYHITDDGDVYRINEDGSFTSMGNAENISTSAESTSDDNIYSNEKSGQPAYVYKKNDKGLIVGYKKSKNRFIVALLIGLIIIGGIGLSYLLYDNTETTYNQNTNMSYSTDTVITPIIPEPAAEEVEEVEDNNRSTKETSQKPHESSNTKSESKIQKFEESVKITGNSSANATEKDVIDVNKIYYTVEVQAEFPGGDRARSQWLRDNIQWPRDNQGRQLEGDVELEFIIERDGTVTNVKVTYSENPDLNSAAINLISSMPKWTPAMVKNQPVRSPMGITLFF